MITTNFLTVPSKMGQVKGSTEASFEKRVADVLQKKIGLFTYHVAERYYAGIPDRYVVGGNWVEFKVIGYSGNRKVNPHRLFSPSQRVFLDKFSNSGDRTWACIGFQGPDGPQTCVIAPWHEFREHGQWSPEQIKSSGVPVGKDLEGYVRLFFGREYERYSNGEIYERAYETHTDIQHEDGA